MRASRESEGRRSKMRPLGKEERVEEETTMTKLHKIKKCSVFNLHLLLLSSSLRGKIVFGTR